MPDAPAPAAAESATTDSPMSFEQAAEAALGEQSGSAPAQDATAPSEGKAETTPAPIPVEEPDYVRWVKSVSGNTDAQGNINVDRVLKQAYELNRQNQLVAQKLSQFNQALQHPEIQKVVMRLANPQQAQEPAQAELTDEQILNQHIEKIIEQRMSPVLSPLQEQAQLAFERAVKAETDSAFYALQEEFGKDEFNSVIPEIQNQLQMASLQSGVPIPQILGLMVQRGALYPAMAQIARNALFPQLKQRINQASQTAQDQNIEAKKKLTMAAVKGGTPVKQVSKPAPKIDTWEDAWKAAEKELEEAKA